MSFERSRGKRASLNFPLDQKAFDESAIPQQALAAKQSVLAAKRPDNIGVHKPGWNISTVSENMYRFPDRPMMRQLSAFDSHKRADYNYRAEELDWRATKMYVPMPNKFQYNERSTVSEGDRLPAPPFLSRTEFPVHSALVSKERWDPATGHGGDPYRAQKERERQQQQQIEAALEHSRRHPPKQRDSLVARETTFSERQREAKRTARASGLTYGGLVHTRPSTQCTAADELEMTRQVPRRATTTWSLGSF